MKKFLAVLKREYKKVVFTWTFLITTFLMPVIASAFVLVPMLIFSMEGDATRIAVADLNGNVAPRIKQNLSPEKIAAKAEAAAKEAFKDFNPSQEEKMKRSAEQIGGSFTFVDYDPAGKLAEEIRAELSAKVGKGELEAFLIVPKQISGENVKIEFLSRKAGDFVINSTLEDAVNEGVRSQRLAEANIDESELKKLSTRVSFDVRQLTDTGDVKEQDSGPWTAFVVAMLIYVVLAIYGQAIMSAIVEEKETRISEVLFSSARPFELMMGKLVGVGLAGLTQLGIWLITISVFIGLGLASAAASGLEITLPDITPLMVGYFLIFFLLGYFIYATMYALVGSVVTNMQEGGQFALPPIFLLLIGLYFCFAVVRDPNSTFAFWVSIAPFFAPLVMPVRILAETPPFWQIVLAVIINLGAIVGLTWVAARVYRVGMLMYGKRATIPEIWKWIRQT